MTCGACRGRGAQTVKEPVETCGRCRGNGREPSFGAPLYCSACNGVGLATVRTVFY